MNSDPSLIFAGVMSDSVQRIAKWNEMLDDATLSIQEKEQIQYFIAEEEIKAGIGNSARAQGIPFVAKVLIDTFMPGLLTDPEKKIKAALDSYVDKRLITSKVAESMTKELSKTPALGALVIGVLPSLMIIGSVVQGVSAINNLAGQDIKKAIRPELPSYNEIVRAVFIDPTLMPDLRDIMARNGWTDAHIDMAIKGLYSTLDIDTIRNLYFRGKISSADADKKLSENGYTPERIKLLKETWSLIPGVGDLIQFAVKEAFSPEQVRDLQLDSEFPAEILEHTKAQGLDEKWTRKFWQSHWILPSAGQGYEMLHRGRIDMDMLDKLLKALDYSPAWREHLREISYNVVTRVDARRMYEIGAIGEDKLLRYYLDMGYIEEDAIDLVAWTKIEYGEERKSAALGQILKAFEYDFLSETETNAYIRKMGYSQEATDVIIQNKSTEIYIKNRTELVNQTKKLYIGTYITKEEAVQNLVEAGIDPEKITSKIEEWDVDIVLGIKLPTRADLDKFIKHGLIAKDFYFNEMRRMKYSESYIQLYYDSALAEAEG